MWFALALASAFFQVLRNMTMKQLGHRLDEYINVWGRFTFLLPFTVGLAWFMVWRGKGWPGVNPRGVPPRLALRARPGGATPPPPKTPHPGAISLRRAPAAAE